MVTREQRSLLADTDIKHQSLPHERFRHHHRSHIRTLSLIHSHAHTFYRESSLRKKRTLSIKGNNASLTTIHSSTTFRSHHHHSSLSLSLFNLNLLIKAVNISFVLFISVLFRVSRVLPVFSRCTAVLC